MKLEIDYTKYQDQLLIKRSEGKRYIYDPIRKKQLVLLPEEVVRQLMIQYLIHEKKVNVNRINVEKQLVINGLKKRFDIVVYQQNLAPFLLIECKAPSVPITQSTFDQIAQYNLALKMDYLLVSNGLATYCCQMDYEHKSFQFLDHIPDFPN